MNRMCLFNLLTAIACLELGLHDESIILIICFIVNSALAIFNYEKDSSNV